MKLTKSTTAMTLELWEPPNPQRKASTKAGSHAEAIAESHFKLCRLAGVAHVYRVPNDWVVIGKTKQGDSIVKPRRKSAPDYMGHLANGRNVMVEVKSACNDSAAWKFDTLQDHQKLALDRCHKAGGVALVLVVGKLACYALPWPLVDAVTKKAKQIALSKLERFRIPANVPFLKAWLNQPFPNTFTQTEPVGNHHD